MWFLEQLCCDIDNCVMTVFLCSFFKLVPRPSFYVSTTFLFGSCYNDVSCIVSISVATRKVYRHRVLLPLNLISCCNFILILRHSLLVLSMFAIATQFVMSRQDLSSLCWNLCRDLVYQYLAYLYVVALRSLS